MSPQIDEVTIPDSDPLVVYNSPASTNNSSTETWNHETWTVDGISGTFATTSSPTAFLSFQFPKSIIGFEYWGFFHTTPGNCFIRITSSLNSTEPGAGNQFATIPTQGNPGPPVMLFSTQLVAPATPSVFLGNAGAPVMDIVSFVLILPGAVTTTVANQGPVTQPANVPASLPPVTSVAPRTTQPPGGTPSFSQQVPSLPIFNSASVHIPTPVALPSPIAAPSSPLTHSLTSTKLFPPITATPLFDPTSSSHSSNRRAGQIAGGVVGALAFLCLLFGFVYYRFRRQRRENQSSKAELDSSDSTHSTISSEAPNVITPFPPVQRPVSVPVKLGGRQSISPPPPLHPVRPIPYGVKPSQMRPPSPPMREEGPSQPTSVLPRAKHASLPRQPDESTSHDPARYVNDVFPGGIGSSDIAQNLSRPIGPRRAVDGGPLALAGGTGVTSVMSPPTY